MSLDDLVSVSITIGTATPTRPGFGTILIAAADVPAGFTDRVRQYRSPKEMIDDGFTTTMRAYKIAQKLFSQDPRVKFIKVGRRANKFTQKISLTPTSTTEDYVYSINIGGYDVSYEVGSAATTDSVCEGIAAAIEGVTGLASLVAAVATPTSATHVEVTTGTVGAMLDYTSWDSQITFKDTTPDPGLENDLNAIFDEDADFYGLVLDSNSAAEVTVASAWANANRKLFGFTSTDTEIVDAGNSADIFSTQMALNPAWTFGYYKKKQLLSDLAAVVMADRFPYDPGSDTWAYKTVSGVTADNLTGGEITAIEAKRGNYYIPIAGLSATQNGKTFANEWIDVTRGLDWLKSEIQIREYALFMNNQKVPYTETGADMIKSVLQGCLEDGISAGLLAADPPPQIFTQPVAEIDAVTKGSRVYPNLQFTATLAGAIHKLEVDGLVTS